MNQSIWSIDKLIDHATVNGVVCTWTINKSPLHTDLHCSNPQDFSSFVWLNLRWESVKYQVEEVHSFMKFLSRLERAHESQWTITGTGASVPIDHTRPCFRLAASQASLWRDKMKKKEHRILISNFIPFLCVSNRTSGMWRIVEWHLCRSVSRQRN